MTINSAFYADQSNPDCNRQFSRRWTDPLPDVPAALDRLADRALQSGDRRAAERLSWRALALRETRS